MVKIFLQSTYMVSRGMQVVSCGALVFMMLLTTSDVILRIFGRPIIGTYEIVSFSGAITVGFGLPITSWLRGHIFVDFLYRKFPVFYQGLFNILTRFMVVVFFIFLGLNLWRMAASMARSGEVSLTLKLPFYPVAYAIGVIAFIECLVFIADCVKIVRGEYE
jgi:TRAP-type C4-dicarboxylate transport system permease small subunit